MKTSVLFVFNSTVDIAFVAVIFLLIIFLFYRVRKLGEQLRNLKKQLGSEIEQLEAKITKILNQVNRCDSPLAMNRTASKQPEQQDQKEGSLLKGSAVEDLPTEIVWKMDKQQEPEEEAENENIFYLASPDKERAFYAPEATVVPNKQTLYVIKENVLELYDKSDGQAMQSAMNSFEIIIKRVCDVSNIKESNHSKIVMLEPGKVFRENDDFVVTDKIIVKFQ